MTDTAAPPASAPDEPGNAEGACPIAPVVDLVFSRWTTPILWVLRHHGRLRFTELQGYVGPITAKVLTQRLRQLERDGLIERTQYMEIPPRVEYEISDLGRTLGPVFASLVGWSEEHMGAVLASRRAYEAAGNPRPA